MTEEDTVSDSDLATFEDAESDECAKWKRIGSEALRLCEPLARMLGHKRIATALDMSKGQLSRELSDHYENRLSLPVGLYIAGATQHERLTTLLTCDAMGLKMPEWQRRQVTDADELRAIKAELREAGVVGVQLMERAKRRARSGR